MNDITLIHGDCLEVMENIPDKSIDMILCDLPYGTTNCKWDKHIIPFEPLWEQYNRIMKNNGAILLFAAQPFTTQVVESNRKIFRYCWYWVKNNITGFAFAKYQPMRRLEEICVFYKEAPIYNPQGLIKLDKPFSGSKRNDSRSDYVYKMQTLSKPYKSEYTNYPNNVISFDSDTIDKKKQIFPSDTKACRTLRVFC